MIAIPRQHILSSQWGSDHEQIEQHIMNMYETTVYIYTYWDIREYIDIIRILSIMYTNNSIIYRQRK